MNQPIRKKLIEVSIPLEAINVASVREKQIKTGKPLQIHHYWARRPLTTCRAVLFAQLVDDPSAWPDRFPSADEQDAERRRLHKLIEAMVPWETSNDEAILKSARWEIARSVAWGLGEEPPAPDDGPAILNYLQTKAPPVYDPFSGGGSIPLEAQRLGLRAYGSDLNPVAVLIGKGLVEFPTRFAGRAPVNPYAVKEAEHGQVRGWRGAQGLADDLGYYGRRMRDEAEKRFGTLYPQSIAPDGSKATVVAWIWARTVRSPDPAARGAHVPLVSSFVLSTKPGRKTWIKPVIASDAPEGYRFEVHTGEMSKAQEDELKKGTKSAKGQAFTCILTGTAIDRDYIQAEGKADRLGQRMMAVVIEGTRGRLYLSPTTADEQIAGNAVLNESVGDARATFLSAPTPTRAMITGGVCSAYGIRSWGLMFTPRQLVALTGLSDLVSEICDEITSDAIAAGMRPEPTGLEQGGCGARAYADAVATYLGLALDRVVDWNNTGSRWESKVEVPQQLFARQALPMTWDFSEANPIGTSTGSLLATLDNMKRAFAALSHIPPGFGEIRSADAALERYVGIPAVVSTDPPYFDNISYADLSDFFYVWLKRAVGRIWPDLFRRIATPKADELVATPYRFIEDVLPAWAKSDATLGKKWVQMSPKDRAEAFFMRGMSNALKRMSDAADVNCPIVVYYAFKQSDSDEDGKTSAGWSSFLQAMLDAGLGIDGTWPMRTELANRMIGKGANALASSIVLVCRKREAAAPVVTRTDFIRALKREMPDAIDAIRRAGVGPVDMQQSVIGPGMGVFSRYAKVLEDDDSAMSVKTALALINRVWEEIENELDQAFDPETQVALAWFATYGFDARASGELITLTNAKNTSDRALFASGVFKDMKGKAGLTPRGELPRGWSPAADRALTTWECVQHTARVLNAPDGGGEAAAALVAQMGPKAEEARALAYRLFEIATNKGWSAEALVYNELAQEWTKLEDIAAGLHPAASPARPMQGAFAFEESPT
jgi:putative DNA methylase